MYRYKGGKDVIGIPGVPARDLTDDEAAEYGVTENELYEKVTRRRGAAGVREEPDNGRDSEG